MLIKLIIISVDFDLNLTGKFFNYSIEFLMKNISQFIFTNISDKNAIYTLIIIKDVLSVLTNLNLELRQKMNLI